MFSPRSMTKFRDDLFNRNHKRNAQNTEQFSYNCGGYALGTFSWYLPSYSDTVWGIFRHYNEDQMAEITEEAVEIMLHDFPDLRLISDLRQVQKDEYAIAFRVSSDGDFHYARQDYYKKWSYKRGSTAICKITQRYVFRNDWHGRYNGPLILFAKKRG